MIIWILAVLLVAGLVFVGYAQGAIRVGCSLLGILIGWLMAVPLAPRVAPLFTKMGMNDPVLPLLCGGLLVFILISSLFKIIAFFVHRMVETHYKYRASDTKLLLWERLNKRIGACLGAANAVLYLILISGLIYGFGYWTAQMAGTAGDPFVLRVLNSAARGLRSSGFIKTAGATVPMDRGFYDAADLAGLLYNNPLAEARLARYPAFLSFCERPEFQAIANSQGEGSINDLRQRRESLAKLIAHPLVQTILTNKELMAELETVVSRDLEDLVGYIQTGKSPKYDNEKILGRWLFSVNGTLAQVRINKPNISSGAMLNLRVFWRANLYQALLVVTSDRQVFLKGVPGPSATPGEVGARQTLKGEWDMAPDGYRMTLQGRPGEMRMTIQGDLLIVNGFGTELAFYREI